MKTFATAFALLTIAFTACSVSADDAPANSRLALEDSFDRQELGEGWRVNTGQWKIVDGVLRASEIPADKHSAAARRTLATQNAVYQLKFRLTGSAKGFHLGFDPAKGELKKKGHLFSVVIQPTGWKILKHLDKNNPKADPNKIIASEQTKFETGKWHTLRITTWGPYVTAKIDDDHTLKGSHPTFTVKKPTLVFRCIGDGVELDDLKVWTPVEK